MIEESMIEEFNDLHFWDEVFILPRPPKTVIYDKLREVIDLDGYPEQSYKAFKYHKAIEFFLRMEITIDESLSGNDYEALNYGIQRNKEVLEIMFQYGADWTWYKFTANHRSYSVQSVANIFVGKILEFEYKVVKEEEQFTDAIVEKKIIESVSYNKDSLLVLMFVDKGELNDIPRDTDDSLILYS